MVGWRIRGRWTGGGKTDEDEFVILTIGTASEEVQALALRHLVDRCVQATNPNGKISVELTEDPVQLPRVVTSNLRS
jgi:hypothetical protein